MERSLRINAPAHPMSEKAFYMSSSSFSFDIPNEPYRVHNYEIPVPTNAVLSPNIDFFSIPKTKEEEKEEEGMEVDHHSS